MFQEYLGTDEMTSKSVRITRRKTEDGSPFRTKREAEREAARLKAEFAERGIKKKQKKITFREVYEEWMTHYAEEVRVSTLANTERRFVSFILPHFGDVLIDKADKQNWQKERPKEYKRLIGFTKRVFDYAMHVELIDTNPMRNLHVPKLQLGEKERLNSVRRMN